MNRTALFFTLTAALAVGCVDQSEPGDADHTTVTEENAIACSSGATLVPTFYGPTYCLRTYRTYVYAATESWHDFGAFNASIVGESYLHAYEQQFDVILMKRYLGVPFIAIRCPNGNYLSAVGGGGSTAQCTRPAVGDWETFRVQDSYSSGEGPAAFETSNGHFLQMPHSNGPLEAAATWVGKDWNNSWEQFQFNGAMYDLCVGPNHQSLCPMEPGRWL
jgi:hypothetical protein